MNDKSAGPALQLRKQPRQQRSIQRLEAILDAAIALVSETGVSDLKMSDIAARAGIPIGSLYQFFPDKSAVLTALHHRHTSRVEALAREFCSGVISREEAAEQAANSVAVFYDQFRNSQTYLHVWLAAGANPDLVHLNGQHLANLSDSFFNALKHLVPEEDHTAFRQRIVLHLFMSGNIVRFAMMQDEAAARVYLSQWQEIVRRTLFVF